MQFLWDMLDVVTFTEARAFATGLKALAAGAVPGAPGSLPCWAMRSRLDAEGWHGIASGGGGGAGGNMWPHMCCICLATWFGHDSFAGIVKGACKEHHAKQKAVCLKRPCMHLVCVAIERQIQGWGRGKAVIGLRGRRGCIQQAGCLPSPACVPCLHSLNWATSAHSKDLASSA